MIKKDKNKVKIILTVDLNTKKMGENKSRYYKKLNDEMENLNFFKFTVGGKYLQLPHNIYYGIFYEANVKELREDIWELLVHKNLHPRRLWIGILRKWALRNRGKNKSEK